MASFMHNDAIVCRYFSRGMCRFGEMCRFVHILPTASSVNDDQIMHTTATNHMESPIINASKDIKPSDPTSWVMAPDFIPKQHKSHLATINLNTDSIHNSFDGASSSSSVNFMSEPKSYAQVAGGNRNNETKIAIMGSSSSSSNIALCPYEGNCPYGITCTYYHGNLCDMCGNYCLHPTDKELRKKHINECIQQHEKNMELSFAIAKSKDKTCGVCFDIIVEKSGREQRFGILPNCNHIFCLQCIRKWRQAKQFDNKIIRACPECRTPSDFVCPSAFWVETKEEKDKLIDSYKSALGEKDCKYFKKGLGTCPFGNKCFYKHTLPNGDHVDVGEPKRNTRKVQRDAEIFDLFDIFLYDFVDRRDFELRDFLTNLSDSESGWSDEYD